MRTSIPFLYSVCSACCILFMSTLLPSTLQAPGPVPACPVPDVTLTGIRGSCGRVVFSRGHSGQSAVSPAGLWSLCLPTIVGLKETGPSLIFPEEMPRFTCLRVLCFAELPAPYKIAFCYVQYPGPFSRLVHTPS